MIDLKRIALLAGAAFATLAGVVLLWQLREILALVLVSITLAAMTADPIAWLVRHRIPESAARLLVYALCVFFVILTLWFGVPPLVAEIQTAAVAVGAAYAGLHTAWSGGSSLQQSLLRSLPTAAQLDTALMGTAAGIALQAFGATLKAFDLLGQSLLVLFISLYWSADHMRFERIIFSSIGPIHRTRVREAWHAIEQGLGAYLRSELTQCLLAAISLTVGFTIMGLPVPIIFATFAAMAWLLPLVGGILAVLPLLLVGASNLPQAIGALLFTCTVFAVLEFVVERKMYPRQRHDSVLVLLITIIMVEALGVVGLLIAPPIAKAIQIGALAWLKPVVAVNKANETTSSLQQIKDRLLAMRETLASTSQPSPRTVNLFTRLDGLIERSEQPDK